MKQKNIINKRMEFERGSVIDKYLKKVAAMKEISQQELLTNIVSEWLNNCKEVKFLKECEKETWKYGDIMKDNINTYDRKMEDAKLNNLTDLF